MQRRDFLHLYLDSTDSLILDGQPITLAMDKDVTLLQGQILRIKRLCGDRTAYAALEFNDKVQGSLQRAYDVGKGAVHLLSVSIAADTDFSYQVKLG